MEKFRGDLAEDASLYPLGGTSLASFLIHAQSLCLWLLCNRVFFLQSPQQQGRYRCVRIAGKGRKTEFYRKPKKQPDRRPQRGPRIPGNEQDFRLRPPKLSSLSLVWFPHRLAPNKRNPLPNLTPNLRSPSLTPNLTPN